MTDARIALSPFPIGGELDAFVALVAPAFSGDRAMPEALFRQTREFLNAKPRPDPWGSYLASLEGEMVGSCAFKSAPDASGAVEIAYFTFPKFEGQGVARAMVRALVELAFDAGARLVFARTLPEPNASNHVLEGQGFEFAGTVEDPEDGPVWEWRLPGHRAP
jgi:RimJ/RimL family protein N-acetyltransferase